MHANTSPVKLKFSIKQLQYVFKQTHALMLVFLQLLK